MSDNPNAEVAKTAFKVIDKVGRSLYTAVIVLLSLLVIAILVIAGLVYWLLFR